MSLIPKETKLDRFKDIDPMLLGESQISEAINLLSKSLIVKRENQILEALKENGYTLENKYQLQRFAEEMCTVFSFEENNRKILKVGNEFVCEWDDTFYYENNGNEINAGFGLKD